MIEPLKPHSLCIMRFSPLVSPTVHPAGQEQSPVMWWHVPPFWQGQLCSQWKPWLPEGHRSPQLSHASRESDFAKGEETKDKCSSKQGLKHRGMKEMLVLTKRPSIPADRCILLSRGRRSRHWDTGRAADKPCRSSRAHRAPRSAIPGSRQCRHRPPWWGYTWPRFGIDTDCCSEVPSSRSRSLRAQKEPISEYLPRYRHITSNES